MIITETATKQEESTFNPQIVKKHQKDISDIDQKIISMYAKGMTTRQISETISDGCYSTDGCNPCQTRHWAALNNRFRVI